MGIDATPRYNKSLCLESFPFPDTDAPERASIGDTAERMHAHRKSALDRDERITMTGMYNVVEKLRSGDALTPKERTVHELAACGVLRDLHDELDRLVAEAYGWPWPMEREEILERLVALHDERVEEEQRGLVRWLRPDYQSPRFGKDLPERQVTVVDDVRIGEGRLASDVKLPWPLTAAEQIAAVAQAVGAHAGTAEEVAARFTAAKREIVARHLETLALLGELASSEGRYFRPVGRAA